MKTARFLGNVTGGLAALNLVGRPLISWAGPEPIDLWIRWKEAHV